jgi:hypothetical protein
MGLLLKKKIPDLPMILDFHELIYRPQHECELAMQHIALLWTLRFECFGPLVVRSKKNKDIRITHYFNVVCPHGRILIPRFALEYP